MDRIYLDHAATTPLRPEAAEAMAEVRAVAWGNPSSPHAEGRKAREALERARRQVAELLGTSPPEVLFVRGGTEADNLAVAGRARAEPRGPLVISVLEHSAVRACALELARGGREVIVLPVTPAGTVPGAALEAALASDPPPALVSVQQVNSESGLVLALEPVLEGCRARGIPVHVDAAQAPGRLPLPDLSHPARPALLALSAHKFGGPRGVGILVRSGGVALAPLLHGGPQESGMRPGTQDVEGAVGAATALEIALREEAREAPRLRELRDHLQAGLVADDPRLRVVGHEGRRSPHHLLLALPGVPRDLLPGVVDLEGVAASAGSACRSGASEPSPAFRAMVGDGAGDWASAEGGAGEGAMALAPLRLSLGWTTTREDVKEARVRIGRALARIQAAPQGADRGAVGRRG